MSLDSARDFQVAALAALLLDGVNSDMREELLGASAIESIHPWPLRIELIPALKLPALSVYRISSRRVVRGNRRVEEATVRFDYILPGTPRDRMATRWAALYAVWSAIAPIALRGSHPQVASGTNLLQLANVVSVDPVSPSVRFELPTDERQTYPGFSGTITLQHLTREEIDDATTRAALADLVDLDALYMLGDLELLEEYVEP